MDFGLCAKMSISRVKPVIQIYNSKQRYKETNRLGRVKVGDRRRLTLMKEFGMSENLYWVIVTKIEEFYDGKIKKYKIYWKKEEN